MGFVRQTSNSLLFIAFGLLVLAFTAYYNFHLFSTSKIVGNGASRALVALGPQLEIGLPYRDLYEFVPPGFLIAFNSWVAFAGMSMNSFRLFHVSLILAHGLFLLLVCKKCIPSSFLAMMVFLLGVASSHVRTIQSDIFSLDLAGTTLALGGLAALVAIKNLSLRVNVSLLLFILAGQMKDIYILSALTVIPLYLRELCQGKNNFIRLFILSLVAPLIVGLMLLMFFIVYPVLPNYIQIVKDKSSLVNLQISIVFIVSNFYALIHIFLKTFLKYRYSLELLLLINLSLGTIELRRMLGGKGVRQSLIETKQLLLRAGAEYSETHFGKTLACGVFVLAMMCSLVLYGKYSVDTRFVAVTTSISLLLGILFIYPWQFFTQNFKNKFLTLAGMSVVLLAFLPQRTVFSAFKLDPPNTNVYYFEVEKLIQERTQKTDCILHIYGWEVSPTYLYSQRKPCTKYFLVNIIYMLKEPRVLQEYQQDIFKNPPAVILLNTKGADFPIERFEKEVIDIPNILENCYEIDPIYVDYYYPGYFLAPVSIYWPRKEFSKVHLQSCVEMNGRI